MSKKDLANVTADLTALAAQMPSQRPAASIPVVPLAQAPAPKAAPASRPEAEPTAQFSLELRKSLRKQLASLAAEADMTMRAFVLNALREQGLDVRPDDLTDLRKERR